MNEQRWKYSNRKLMNQRAQIRDYGQRAENEQQIVLNIIHSS
jgi:hypothetical protein